MNKYEFAFRNILDKIFKAMKNFEVLKFYLQIYLIDNFKKVDSDIYIVSYPKCGRTWLRVILKNYISLSDSCANNSKDAQIFNLSCENETKIIKFTHDQGNWVPAPKKINEIKFNYNKHKNKKIIFLIRDPRDVVVSSWYHLKYRENIYKKDLSSFIRDNLVGIGKIIFFMNMWIKNKDEVKDFLLISYEGLHKDSFGVLEKVLSFCDIKIDKEKLKQAISDAHFSKMKKIETKGELNEPWMKPGMKNLKQSMKVRKGKIGSYKNELNDIDIKYLDKKIQQELDSELMRHLNF